MCSGNVCDGLTDAAGRDVDSPLLLLLLVVVVVVVVVNGVCVAYRRQRAAAAAALSYVRQRPAGLRDRLRTSVRPSSAAVAVSGSGGDGDANWFR